MYDEADDDDENNRLFNLNSIHSFDIAAKLGFFILIFNFKSINNFNFQLKGIKLPDLAPSIEDYNIKTTSKNTDNEINDKNHQIIDESESSIYEPKKKKYAKEAWPGRKPTLPSTGSTSPSLSFNLF